MKIFKTQSQKALFVFIAIVVASLLLFHGMFSQYFLADDWITLNLSHVSQLTEIGQFFSFSANPHQNSLYRPLPSQFFFWGMRLVFGLWAPGWFMVVVLIFVFDLWLVYQITQKLGGRRIALLATGLYALSQTNFTRLFFLSAAQELFLVAFTLTVVWLWQQTLTWKKYGLSVLCFLAALASKETAIVIPVGLYLFFWWGMVHNGRLPSLKKIWQAHQKFLLQISPFVIITAIYGYLRFMVFGLTQTATAGQSYAWSFLPHQALNTLIWYTLWSLGAAETFLNYVTGSWKVMANFYTDFPTTGSVMIGALIALIMGLVALLVLFTKRQLTKPFKLTPQLILFLLGTIWYLVTLAPVLFLPNHKYALELGLPLLGFCWILATLTAAQRKLGYLAIVLFVILNVTSVIMSNRTHYTVLRSHLSQKVVSYFLTNYPTYPTQTAFVFVNDVPNLPANWGVSKQILEAAADDQLFKVIYPQAVPQIYYQDKMLPDNRETRQIIKLSSKQFLEN